MRPGAYRHGQGQGVVASAGRGMRAHTRPTEQAGAARGGDGATVRLVSPPSGSEGSSSLSRLQAQDPLTPSSCVSFVGKPSVPCSLVLTTLKSASSERLGALKILPQRNDRNSLASQKVKEITSSKNGHKKIPHPACCS